MSEQQAFATEQKEETQNVQETANPEDKQTIAPAEIMLKPKYIINIRLEKDYQIYAMIARRLLEDEKAPSIVITACGQAIYNLLKVSSILSEHMPSLHKVSRISYSNCKTCISKIPID